MSFVYAPKTYVPYQGRIEDQATYALSEKMEFPIRKLGNFQTIWSTSGRCINLKMLY